MNHQIISRRYGFTGVAERLIPDTECVLAFCEVQPRASDMGSFGRKQGTRVVRGYFDGGLFVDEDGWTGWNYTLLFFNPKPIPFRSPKTPEGWELDLALGLS